MAKTTKETLDAAKKLVEKNRELLKENADILKRTKNDDDKSRK